MSGLPSTYGGDILSLLDAVSACECRPDDWNLLESSGDNRIGIAVVWLVEFLHEFGGK
jgi:hypothetical protein